jgi:hypothetical protein
MLSRPDQRAQPHAQAGAYPTRPRTEVRGVEDGVAIVVAIDDIGDAIIVGVGREPDGGTVVWLVQPDQVHGAIVVDVGKCAHRMGGPPV